MMKLTDQEIKNIKGAPERLQAGIKGFETVGGKLLGFYILMGSEYDYLAIGEGLDDNGALAFSLALGSLGNVRTTTVSAFTPEQFAAIVKKLP
jgi:uncharacterized protein with GYD domain